MIDADIRVEGDGWGPVSTLEALTAACLEAALAEVAEAPGPGELAVLFTDDAAQRVLNREHRGKDAPTNVLSFPAADSPLPPGVPRPFGDISLARETVEREARAGGIAFEAHLQHLIIHGFLHLLNYDHETDAAAAAMETTETKALARLGIADPYCPKQV